MTNLEFFLADPDAIDERSYIEIYMKPGYELVFHNSEETNLIRWLVSEHVEPLYKLNKFEYELLKAIDMDEKIDHSFSSFAFLLKMKEKFGYFKSIEDKSVFISCVLDNCEVIINE